MVRETNFITTGDRPGKSIMMMSLNLCNETQKVTGVLLVPTKGPQALRFRIVTKQHRILVGIDPGVSTGFAVWDRPASNLLRVETRKIHAAMEEIPKLFQRYNRSQILVRVEDARQRQWLPRERNNSEYRGKLMGAGSVMRDCRIWDDYLKSLKIDYEMIPPAAGSTKWSEEYFRKLTKFVGRCSSHGRDAAVLVFGL